MASHLPHLPHVGLALSRGDAADGAVRCGQSRHVVHPIDWPALDARLAPAAVLGSTNPATSHSGMSEIRSNISSASQCVPRIKSGCVMLFSSWDDCAASTTLADTAGRASDATEVLWSGATTPSPRTGLARASSGRAQSAGATGPGTAPRSASDRPILRHLAIADSICLNRPGSVISLLRCNCSGCMRYSVSASGMAINGNRAQRRIHMSRSAAPTMLSSKRPHTSSAERRIMTADGVRMRFPSQKARQVVPLAGDRPRLQAAGL